MDERTFQILELPAILDRAATYAGFSLGKERVRALRPAGSLIEARDRLRLTSEARQLFEIRGSASVGGAHDVRETVRRAGLGGRLEPKELLDVRSTLESMRQLRTTILPLRDQIERLAEVADGLTDQRRLEEEIARCVDDRGSVLDSASPALARIRSELRTAHARLLDRLNAILTSSEYRDIIQDPIITMRDGRYVVPIKAEARGRFRSVVHDQSASGATLFVEPLLTLDLNNRWRQLQLDEEQEIARVLLELSQKVGLAADAIIHGVEALGELDALFACASYASTTRATEPRLVNGEGIDPDAETRLLDARHPLLGESVVPITVRLGGDFTLLVITGPNTGGKTVALKTVGLLTLMALSGLHLPAREGSTVRFVEEVYADIGDEQSIEQSLSTFSSHLRQVVSVLERATARSLVLLDEVGAGTDPAEGSALARAILQELLDRRCLAVATTHYSELKAFAHTTPGVANASVEFDVETLSPTYRLIIGLPGRSNALAIAARLGLEERIIDNARSHISENETRVEILLTEIQSERERVDRERASAEREHRRVTELARQLSKRLATVDREKRRAVQEAHAKAEAELEDVRERLRELTRQIERTGGDRAASSGILQETRALDSELRRRRPAAPAPEPVQQPSIQQGAWVRIQSLGQVGRVTALEDGGAEIQIGAFKMRARLDDLKPATRAEADRLEGPDYGAVQLPRSSGPLPSSQIEIRGLRADQVAPELDRYLNDAYMSGLPQVRIVHGKGTGVLRDVVRDHLGRHPLVQSFETAERREGGEGVTIASLAN